MCRCLEREPMSERQTIKLNERGEEISDAPAAQQKKKKAMVAWIIGGSMIFVVLLVVGLLIYAFHEPARKTVTVDPNKVVDDGSGNGPQVSGLTPLVKFPVDADPGPKVVSAKLQNVLPQEAVHELAKQAGATLPE